MRNISLKQIALPDFGMSAEMPEIPAAEYEKRIANTIAAMERKGIDVLLVFADREHFANFSFLTSLDPRFEEAIFLLDRRGKRTIVLGNECMGALGKAPYTAEYVLFQDFSLLGQKRESSQPLETILKNAGIEKGKRVGCAYHKFFYDAQRNVLPYKLDVPAYLADMLREIIGSKEDVTNVNDVFMDAAAGLRNTVCIEVLVRFEWASTRTSTGIYNLVKNIKPGVREYELAANYITGGLPHSCHPMVSTGEKAKFGLSNPSANKVQLGDTFTSAFGIWGALTCRAGMVAEDAKQLESSLAAYYEKLWRNYFDVVATWYESIGLGVTGGEVNAKVDAVRDNSLFEFALNPGHTIHLDEWVDSPFYKNSTTELYSGMALQMDIIPVAKMFVAANAEDGIALADETLRKEWASRYPESWSRIQQRRDFMMNQLGINLKPEVLPFSNIPAYYSPYLLRNDMVAVIG